MSESQVKLWVREELKRIIDTGLMYTEQVTPKAATTTETAHPLDKTQQAIEAAKQVGQTKDAFGNPKTPMQLANENQARREAEQQRPPIHDGQIQLAFTEDMANRLSFERKGDYHIIKPKAFLGSDLFFAVNKIIKDTLHGEYISASIKEAHWRVKA